MATVQLPKSTRLFQKKKEDYDSGRKRILIKDIVQELKPPARGDKVWISDTKTWGTVQEERQTRSYIVISDSGGTYQRNRRHLVQYIAPQDEDLSGESDTTPPKSTESNSSLVFQSKLPVLILQVSSRVVLKFLFKKNSPGRTGHGKEGTIRTNHELLLHVATNIHYMVLLS